VLAEPGARLGTAARALGPAGFRVVVSILADAPGAAILSLFAAPDDEEALIVAAAATWAVKRIAGGDETPILVATTSETWLSSRAGGRRGPYQWATVRPSWHEGAVWTVAAWPLRRGAWRALVDEVAQRPRAMVLLADVDWMKAYNDQHGATEGDLAIARIQGAIESAAVEAGAAFVRVGGDEFAVVLDGPTARDAAKPLAERIRADVEALDLALDYRGAPSATRLTVSVGVTPVGDPTALPLDAERARDEAKRAGRNRVWRAP